MCRAEFVVIVDFMTVDARLCSAAAAAAAAAALVATIQRRRRRLARRLEIRVCARAVRIARHTCKNSAGVDGGSASKKGMHVGYN